MFFIRRIILQFIDSQSDWRSSASGGAVGGTLKRNSGNGNTSALGDMMIRNSLGTSGSEVGDMMSRRSRGSSGAGIKDGIADMFNGLQLNSNTDSAHHHSLMDDGQQGPSPSLVQKAESVVDGISRKTSKTLNQMRFSNLESKEALIDEKLQGHQGHGFQIDNLVAGTGLVVPLTNLQPLPAPSTIEAQKSSSRRSSGSYEKKQLDVLAGSVGSSSYEPNQNKLNHFLHLCPKMDAKCTSETLLDCLERSEPEFQSRILLIIDGIANTGVSCHPFMKSFHF
jgi:hypothetical protein